MSDYTLPRAERLRSLKAIRRLFSEGRSGFVYPFRYMFLVDATGNEGSGNENCGNEGCSDKGSCNEGCGDKGNAIKNRAELEVMFSVPKKFHKRANKRNLLKRRMREAYRLNNAVLREKALGKSVDFALVYSTKDILSYKTIEHALRRIMGQISEHL